MPEPPRSHFGGLLRWCVDADETAPGLPPRGGGSSSAIYQSWSRVSPPPFVLPSPHSPAARPCRCRFHDVRFGASSRPLAARSPSPRARASTRSAGSGPDASRDGRDHRAPVLRRHVQVRVRGGGALGGAARRPRGRRAAPVRRRPGQDRGVPRRRRAALGHGKAGERGRRLLDRLGGGREGGRRRPARRRVRGGRGAVRGRR